MLYVGGFGRSGSTLLARILGGIPGFVCVGELEYVWEECLTGRQPCGCGRAFRECEFWGAVFEKAYGGFDRVDLRGILRSKHDVDRMRRIPRLASPRKSAVFLEKLEEYSNRIGRLYRAVREVSGGRVVVDSSKLPSYAYALSNVPDLDLRVVHLVRDSRAVAHSWTRRKLKYVSAGGGEVYMDRHVPAASSVGWARDNLLLEPFERLRSSRYARVRYEDLVDEPEGTVLGTLDLLGEKGVDKLPFADDRRSVELGVDHAVEGNLVRFERDRIGLRPDERWRTEMKRADRRVVTALTAPLLLRYGYRW